MGIARSFGGISAWEDLMGKHQLVSGHREKGGRLTVWVGSSQILLMSMNMTSDSHLRSSAENECDFEALSPAASAKHVSFT